MANLTTNILEIYGNEADIGRLQEDITKRNGIWTEYDLNGLVSPDPDGLLPAWGTAPRAVSVEMWEPEKRPLEIIFESKSVPPHELIRRISIRYPTLVFALRFLDECFCYVGWVVFAAGEHHGARINQDVYRAGDRRFDRTTWEAEPLDSDAVTIDSYEAVDWAERFFEALNVVPREIAGDPELAEDTAAHEAMADKVEDLAPEYENAQTPLGDRRRPLEEFCESASLLEARAECRMAVERALAAQAATQRGAL